MMQAMLNMRQSMAGMGTGAPGAMPQTPAATGTPSSATGMPANPGAGALPNPMFDPAMMQAAMQTMMGGGMGAGAGFGGGMPAPTAGPPEERFAVQLDQLSNMGFPDKHSNLQALQTANGDVNQAISSLLGA